MLPSSIPQLCKRNFCLAMFPEAFFDFHECWTTTLKLTVRTWEWMVGILVSFLGWPICRGYISCRECTNGGFFPKIFEICPAPKPLGKKNATPPQKKNTHHIPLKNCKWEADMATTTWGFKKNVRENPPTSGAWGTMARSTLRMSPETGVGDHLLKPVNLLSRKAQGFSGRKDMKRCKCVSFFVCRDMLFANFISCT